MTDLFYRWVQERINLHGQRVKGFKPIDEDGVWGPVPKVALFDFQRRRPKLKNTAVTDRPTVEALSANIGSTKPMGFDKPDETMPPWLWEMTRRMGLHEKRDNKTLSEWLRGGAYLGNPAKLPWCGDAVETCFARTLPGEGMPNNPFWAQAWAKEFGRACEPCVGAVGVIRWSARAGHVGLVIDWNDRKVKLRGGNQSDRIKDAWFPRSKFIAFRWPISYPVKYYPKVSGGATSGGGMSETR